MIQWSDKESLNNLTDRELLIFILSNQVKLFRTLEYIEQKIDGDENARTKTIPEAVNDLCEDVNTNSEFIDMHIRSL